MKTAIGVPCPYSCGLNVDVFDDIVFDRHTVEFHICRSGVKARALADAHPLFPTDDERRRFAAAMLQFTAKEFEVQLGRSKEPRRLATMMRTAARELLEQERLAAKEIEG